MATIPSPPILVWTPGGGIPVGPVSNPPVYSQRDVTPLVQGQSYVDVVFGSIQTTEDWVLVECIVVNEIDANPLNIWPGIITDKTTAGFRLQLNGMPDSGNYYLHWAVSGVNIAVSSASTYFLSGPSSGFDGVASNSFTVHLPSSTTVVGVVTVTPHDGGGGGVFAPSSVTLTTSASSATFTYTPAGTGAKTISVTNDGGLSNPANLTYTATTAPLPTYTLTGPSSGFTGVASTNFTVTLAGSPLISGTVVVTPSSGGGGGTFTPTTVSVTDASPTATFTYTPASAGAKTISVTNDRGLTNPANLTYTASAAPLSDGDPVSSWLDSSGNGKNATQTGSARPIYKTNIVNSKPVVRFSVAGTSGLNLASVISGVDPWTIFAVMKRPTPGDSAYSICGNAAPGLPLGPFIQSTADLYMANRVGYGLSTAPSNAFHVLTAISDSGIGQMFIDGTAPGGSGIASANSGDFAYLGYYGGGSPAYGNGDIAEIVFYNYDVNSTPATRAGLEKYLGTKYGITVAGGTAIQPDDPSLLSNLKGWWKADSL